MLVLLFGSSFMSGEKRTQKEVVDTILHCSVLVSDTLIRMADLVTLTLLYHPGIEERADKMEQLYQNVLNFIDDITTTIYHPLDKESMSINQYDPIFTNLKNAAKLMADLISLLSQEHINMHLQTMEYFYNLNKSILECINVFNHLVHASSSDILNFDKSRITGFEIVAHHFYRSLLKELSAENSEWQQTFILYLIGEKMSSIVFHCCEACKKMYAARLVIIGSKREN